MHSSVYKRIKSNFYAVAQLFIFAAFLPVVCVAGIPAGIEVTVAPIKTEFDPQDELMVTISYTNVTQSDIRFLKWGTGLDGRLGPHVIDLMFEGKSLAYTGLLIKRLPPTENDFVILPANETLSAGINLDLSYEISRQGQYLMEPISGISHRAQLESATSKFVLSAERPVIKLKQPAQFTECTVSEQNQLDIALAEAESISRVARDDISVTPVSLRSTALRYKEWFGEYDVNHWNSIQLNFNKIYNATATKTIGFDCSCDDIGIEDPNTIYAYVSPNDHYNMNICGAFWRAPLVGTDSKAGTIVHELSHFEVVASTDDIAYGQGAARSLAKNKPSDAIKNADSHEYFAENTPFLSMPEPVFPDLVISSRTISDTNPSVGRPVSVSGTISNQGDGAASSTQLSLSLVMNSNNPIITTTTIPALGSGANIDFQLNFDAPDETGEYAVEICISAVDEESNTANNCSILPQLVVKKIAITAPILQLLLDE